MRVLVLLFVFILGLAIACAGGYGLHTNLASLGHLVAFLVMLAVGGVSMLFSAVRL